MLRRFCNLCQIVETPSIQNLRKFSITTICRLEEQETVRDVFTDDFLEKTPKSEPGSSPKPKENPIIKCKKNEFNFYPGTTYKKFDEIPIASKGWFNDGAKGDYFTIYPVPALKLANDHNLEDLKFSNINLNSRIIENLKNMGLDQPTRIQTDAIPEILSGQNVIISAETGCGKTLAYLIPIMQQILKWKTIIVDRPYNSPFAVIITANRELTLQIGREAKKLVKDSDIDVKTLIGGRTKKMMFNPSIRNVDILIGTVGVLCKMTTWRIYKLDHVRHTVLDEVHALFHEAYNDKLLSLLKRIKFGFIQPGEKIPSSSQMTLASATMPSSMPDYFEQCVDINSLINVSTPNTHRVLVPQKFLRLGPLQKPHTLLKLVKPRVLRKAPTIIFSKDASTSDWISIFLNSMKIKTTSLNGQMSAHFRKDKFLQFSRGEVHVLSATNSAARGLDTTMVDLIINYDFPADTADYVHRCGRTGRVGGVENGRVINFVSRNFEIEMTQKIERIARRGRALPMFDINRQKEDITINQEIKMLLEKS